MTRDKDPDEQHEKKDLKMVAKKLGEETKDSPVPELNPDAYLKMREEKIRENQLKLAAMFGSFRRLTRSSSANGSLYLTARQVDEQQERHHAAYELRLQTLLDIKLKSSKDSGDHDSLKANEQTLSQHRGSDSPSDGKYRKRSRQNLRRKTPGRQIVSGRIYDPTLGTSCHQCRQKTTDPKAIAQAAVGKRA
ncbi:hypothetical protein BGX26_005933 [Mortierella sp. AD094]|nr:hypothetical protein BGX26_005933 [Mortierella sp. AD094]